MRTVFQALVLSVPVTLLVQPAHACRMLRGLDPQDIKHATVVVVGSVWNYEIVFDQAARSERRAYLTAHPELSPETRKLLSDQTGFISDYARFDIQVQEVLAGRSPAKLTVTWNSSTFGEPSEMARGPFLIALRDDASVQRTSGKSNLLTVLNPPCGPGFILPISSPGAKAVRAILEK